MYTLRRWFHWSALCLATALLGSSAVRAETCPVPTVAHPSIAAALADARCDRIELAAVTFEESPVITRAVALVGAGPATTVIRGRVEVRAGQCQVEGMTVHYNQAAHGPVPGVVWAHSGAEVSSSGVVILIDLPLIFAHGFESGSTAGWTSHVP